MCAQSLERDGSVSPGFQARDSGGFENLRVFERLRGGPRSIETIAAPAYRFGDDQQLAID